MKNRVFAWIAIFALLLTACAQAVAAAPVIQEPAMDASVAEVSAVTVPKDGPKVVNPRKVGMSEENLQMIDEFISVGMKAKYYQGAVVLVARHSEIAYFKAFGDARPGEPMQTDAVFRWASMTKPLTTLALMQFYDQGKFELDDPLSKFLPEYQNLQVAVDDGNGNISLVPAKREITMHDLLSYQAGTTTTFYYGSDRATSYVIKCMVSHGVQDLFDRDYTHTLEDNVKALPNCPLAYQPEEGWQYGHMSQDIIGYLVEQWSGKTLDAYMKEAIFEPLQMNETWFYPPESVFSRIPEVTVPGDATTVFTEKTLGILPENAEYTFGSNKTYLSAGGGLHGTAYDYFRFAQMMLNKGELDGVRVISKQAIELMTQPNLDDFKVSTLTGNVWGYGLEVQLTDEPASTGFWLGGEGSYGWRGIWSTLWNNNPTDDTISLVMTQVGDDGVFPYLYLVNDLVGTAVIK